MNYEQSLDLEYLPMCGGLNVPSLTNTYFAVFLSSLRKNNCENDSFVDLCVHRWALLILRSNLRLV